MSGLTAKNEIVRIDRLRGCRWPSLLDNPSTKSRTITDNPFRTARGSDPPALLGRDEEFSAVQYSLALSRDGAPAQPIVFTGLRGMGKTALLRRCVNEARNGDAIVIHAEASDSEPLAETLKRGLERAKKAVASLPERLKATEATKAPTTP